MSKFKASASFFESIKGFFSLVLMVSSSGQIVIPVHSGYTGAPKGLEVFLVDTMHARLRIPAFYTIIPGAHFRERALGTSVGMFSAKIIAENWAPQAAVRRLGRMEVQLPDAYYISFYLGFCHLNLQDPNAALDHFRRALKKKPLQQDMASIYSYIGVCLKDMHQYHQALDALQEGLGFDQERTDIYNLMGFCYFKLKEHESAIEMFRKVIQINPSSAIDYANIGSNYRDLGETEKSMEHYAMALEIDPTIEFARENLLKLQGNN